MKILTVPAQVVAMKRSVLMVGIAMAGMTAHSRSSQPADVTVYVSGKTPPGTVDYGARATVTWIFARNGVRLEWRDGEPRRGAPARGPVQIQVRFTTDDNFTGTPQALAQASLFGSGGGAVKVLYDRIAVVARCSSQVQPILAHVLAHEIGHILQRGTQHARNGVMKAHWDGRDYDAMSRKPLEFTPYDIDLIKQGLTVLEARAVTSSEVRR